MEVSGQTLAPAALPQKKQPPVPIVEEAGWAPEPVWTLWSKEKCLVPTGNRTRHLPNTRQKHYRLGQLDLVIMYAYTGKFLPLLTGSWRCASRRPVHRQ
jgi:hypothetical protein